MIDYLRGELVEVNPVYAVVECHGVGYEVNISLVDYANIQGAKQTKLYIHEAIREDAHVLYGFTSTRGRELFRLLIGVSGVGPNTARLIMGAMPVGELEAAIARGDDKVLKAVKGIGAKTAQRIIVDLKDKINSAGVTLVNQAPGMTEAYDESLSALLTLGFNQQPAVKALKKIFEEHPTVSVENAIKLALKML